MRMQKIIKKAQYQILVLLVLINLSKFGFANDLGDIGPTYPILETDLLSYIKNKLRYLQANGGFGEDRKDFKKLLQGYFKKTSRDHLERTVVSRSTIYDPTITIAKDVFDEKGRIIIHKGEKVNPLDRVNLKQVLLFLNSDDAKQWCWLKKKINQYDHKVKVILVAGDVLMVTRILKRPVYLDQYGLLQRKLKLKHVPAIVTESNKHLKIEEQLPC